MSPLNKHNVIHYTSPFLPKKTHFFAVNTYVSFLYLAHHELVAVVVACEVGEDACSTRHHIDVIAAQQLHQGPEETLHALLQKTTEGEARRPTDETFDRSAWID